MATIKELKQIKFDSEGRAFQAKYAIANIELLKLLSSKEVYISITIHTDKEDKETNVFDELFANHIPDVLEAIKSAVGKDVEESTAKACA